MEVNVQKIAAAIKQDTSGVMRNLTKIAIVIVQVLQKAARLLKNIVLKNKFSYHSKFCE